MRFTIADACAARETGLRTVVLLDGRDVTSRCRWADVALGEVCLLVLNERGQRQLDAMTHAVATEVLSGVVDVQLLPVES